MAMRSERIMKHFSTLGIFACLVLSTCGAVDLTKDNFAEIAGERSVFIKMFAPWCGHCKAMAPAWDALMEDFKDSDTLFVGECDCTAGCKDLCNDVGVQGYPTVKFGSPGALEDYKGARDYESMKRHAETIKPACTPKRREVCSSEELQQLDELLSKSKDDMQKLIKEQEAVIETLESEFKTSLESLQATYTNLVKVKDEKKAQVEASGLRMMRSVLAEMK